MPEGKHIVIVGGGGAGAQLAKNLSQSRDLSPSSGHTLTVLTARPFWIFLIAAARFTTSPENHFEEKCFIPYDKFFDGARCGTVKVGRVMKVEPTFGGDADGKDDGNVDGQGAINRGVSEGGELLLESGERMKYDVLVLAPGSTWGGPLDFPDKKEDIMQHLEVWWKKFSAAKSIVLVGGGAVALEYAGEIKDFYPSTKVTVVHNGPMLLNAAYSEKYRRRVESEFRARGVEIILEDRVDDLTPPTEGKITTRKGKILECDLMIPTYGSRSATSFLNSIEPSILNSRGDIKVNPHLQVDHPSLPTVFAVGNAVDWDEQKQAGKYGKHAKVVGGNILDYLRGKSPTRVYRGSNEAICLSNGKGGGVIFISLFWGWSVILGNWWVRLANGDSYRVERIRKWFGQSE